MNRLTEWSGEHAAVMNIHENYIDRLAYYEDTDLEPDEIVKLKAERDAAVRDIVEAMEMDLQDCVLTHQCWFCAFYNSDDCPLEKEGECAPKWRGPQQEETT